MGIELTDAQRKTIEYFELEVVEFRPPLMGDWFVTEHHGSIVQPAMTFITPFPIVRPKQIDAAKRLAELERRLRHADEAFEQFETKIRKLESEREQVSVMLRDANNTIEKKDRALMALESQLTQIRALPVGSIRWAFHVLATGGIVVDKDGDHWRIHDGELQIRHEAVGEFHKSNCTNIVNYEPYTLYTEPAPKPTTADLAAAIERISKAWVKGEGLPSAITNANVLADRVIRSPISDYKSV